MQKNPVRSCHKSDINNMALKKLTYIILFLIKRYLPQFCIIDK